MSIFNVLMLLPLGIPKIVNKIAYKMRESEKIVPILTCIWTFFMLIIFYKAFWPLDSGMKFMMVIAGLIMAVAIGVTIIVKTYYFVTNLFYEITFTGSRVFDKTYKKLNQRREQGMASGAKAEVGLQYFIDQEKNKSYANVRFYK